MLVRGNGKRKEEKWRNLGGNKKWKGLRIG